MRCRAYTLIELMACIVLTATLSTLAVANLGVEHRSVTLRSAMIELQAADHLMRDRTRESRQPGEMRFDMTGGHVARVEVDRDGRASEVALPGFANTARVKKVRTAAAPRDLETVRINYSQAGRTPSYAVLVSSGSQQQWLFVAGLTGQFETFENEDDIQDIFRQLQGDGTAGHDPR